MSDNVRKILTGFISPVYHPGVNPYGILGIISEWGAWGGRQESNSTKYQTVAAGQNLAADCITDHRQLPGSHFSEIK